MKKLFFGWENIKKFATELVLTMTIKESRFSQKKILIYLIDISMLIASLFYLYDKRATLTAGDLCMVVGMWLAKGTTNVMMTQSDKKLPSSDDTTSDTSSETK
jgi:hypothetical protein